MKKAVCIGINDYPGTANDLNGCVNDANDWSSFLKTYGFETELILNTEATKSNILSALENLVAQANAGDVIVFTYSGHGTSVVDTDGDEADGYDEALYAYDGVVLDDDLRDVLQNVKADVHTIIISDSCFSGTVTRVIAAPQAKAKYIPTSEIAENMKVRRKIFSEDEMVEILISGCSDSEYSYDAYIDGKYNGAFTANAINLLKEGQTYNEFYALLRDELPSSQYPQTPQLEGTDENKNRKVFENDIATGSSDALVDSEAQTGQVAEKSWVKRNWWILAMVAVVAVIAILVWG